MLEEASRLTESIEIKEELIDVEDDTVVSVTKDQNQTKSLPIVKNITQDNYDGETVQKKTKTNDEPDDGTGSNTAMENKVNKTRASKKSKENLGKWKTYFFLLSIPLITTLFSDKPKLRQRKASHAPKPKPNEAER